MSIDFAAMLTNDQKRQLLENRIQQFAAEAYQYSLNLKDYTGMLLLQTAEYGSLAVDVFDHLLALLQSQLTFLPLWFDCFTSISEHALSGKCCDFFGC